MNTPQLPQPRPPAMQSAVVPAPTRGLTLMRDASGLMSLERRRNVYLATVAHEMRNALAPLTGVVEIVAIRASGIPAVTDLLPIARRQLSRLAAMTEDLLDLGRAFTDEFRMTLAREPVKDLLAGVVTAWQLLAEAKHQTLSVDLPAAPIFVLADRVRFGQALQNILANAVKYTPEGGFIALRVGVAGSDARISVSDTGIGLLATDLGRIFELFYRVRNEAVGGAGIGLALARQLIELHGGTIAVRSDGPGRGTTFTISLPLAPAA